MAALERSSFTIDLGAIRRNAATLLRAAEGAELWAVVKAEGYGHGAVDVSKAALDAGASALCVATLPEALQLRTVLRNARIVVLGPVSEREIGEARAARLELVAADGRIAEGVPVHLEIDTGMGRWGLSELPRSDAGRRRRDEPPRLRRGGSGIHAAPGRPLPRGDVGPRAAHAPSREQCGDAPVRGGALRRGSLRDRALRDLAFGADPPPRGSSPRFAGSRTSRSSSGSSPGESTGYGRRFVADRATWIGIVPVGYADGFRRT